jgi:Ca2+-binding EF-hand superfamily protein
MQNGNSLAWFQQCFGLADRQKTGMITGMDAVQFFSRSGLHKKVLAQVWENADLHNRGCLSFEEFVTALRLIAFAQMTLRNLPEGTLFDVQQAKLALANPSFPGVPFLQGVPNQVQMPVNQQQQTGSSPAQSQGSTPALAASPAVPQPVPVTNSNRGSAASSSYLSPQEQAKFRQAFVAMDTDKDGYVAGGECFPVFMKSGLDKSVLKHIWDLVAGNEGKLDEQQFLLSQHFIMLSLKGEKLPTSLPKSTPQTQTQNVLPPSVNNAATQQQSADSGALGGASVAQTPQPQMGGVPMPTMAPSQPVNNLNASSLQGMLQQQPPQQMQQISSIPSLPNASLVSPVTGQFQYAQGTPPMPPNLDSNSGLSYDEKRKMEEANERAKKADQDRQKAAFDLQLANQNKDLYRNTMQELVLFKSKADAELTQLTAKVDSVNFELESSKRLYSDLFEQYGGMQEKYESAKENLMNLHNEKAKIADEIQALSGQSFDENEFEAPLQEVQAEITQLQSQLMLIKQENLQTQQKKQSALTEVQIAKQNLQREIELYQDEIESGRSEADRHQEELISIRNQAQEVLTKATIDKNALSGVLNNCGQIFQALSQAALNCGVEIPSFNLKLDWSASLAQCASDWQTDDFTDGFTPVELGTLSASADMATGVSARDEAILPVISKNSEAAAVPVPPPAVELGGASAPLGEAFAPVEATAGNGENSSPVENSAQEDSNWVSFAS